MFIYEADDSAYEEDRTDTIMKFNKGFLEYSKDPNNDDNSELTQFFKEMKETIKKTEDKSFAWTSDICKNFNSLIQNLKGHVNVLQITFLNLDQFHKEFPVHYFQSLFEQNIGRVGGKNFDVIKRFQSLLMDLFYYNYFRKDLIRYFRMDTMHCNKYDPIFRESLRRYVQNDEYYKQKFENVFDLKKFVIMCLKNLFLNVGWRWVGGRQRAHITILLIVVNMFEYGLWHRQECNELLEVIYSTSEIMSNLENYSRIDGKTRNLNTTYLKNLAKDCALAREYIGQILFHIILIYLDHDVTEKITSFPASFHPSSFDSSSLKQRSFDKEHINQLFSRSFFSKKKLYTFFPYILVTYMTRQVKIKTYEIESKGLNDILNILFTFISDINGDFFKESLKMINKNYFPFYFLKDSNSFEGFNSDIYMLLRTYDQFVLQIKNSPENIFKTIQNSAFDQIINFFNQIDNYLGSRDQVREQFDCKKILLTKYNFILKILLCLQIFPNKGQNDNYYYLNKEEEVDQGLKAQFESNIDKTYQLGLDVLFRICENNTLAQVDLFSGVPLTILLDQLEHKTSKLFFFVFDIVKTNQKNSFLLKLPNFNNLLIERFLDYYNDYLTVFENKDENGVIVEGSEFQKQETIFNFYTATLIQINFYLKSFKMQKGQKIELLNSVYKIIPHIFNWMKDLNFDELNPHAELFKQIYKNPQLMREQVMKSNNLSKLEQKIILLELYDAILKLFYQLTKEFYTDTPYKEISQILEKEKLLDYLHILKFKYGIRIWKNILGIFNSFNNFPNNHLLNNRTQYFQDPDKDELIEYQIPPEMFDVKFFENYLKVGEAVLEYMKKFQDQRKVSDFYFQTYIPGLFKAFKGVICQFEMDFLNDWKKKIFYQIIQTDTKFILLIQNYESIFDPHFYQNEPRRLQNPKYKYHKKNQEFFKRFVEESRSGKKLEYYDEGTGTNLFHSRKRGYNLLEEIIDIYKNNSTMLLYLSFHKLYDSSNNQSMIFSSMEKTLQFNQIYRQQNQAKFKKKQFEIKSNKLSSPYQILKFLKSYYSKTKTYYFEHIEENLSFQILQTSDILKNNVEYYIDYFIEQINNVRMKFEQDENNDIFLNSTITSLILMMDNLVRNNKDFKQTLFDKYKKEKDGGFADKPVLNALNFIWDLHKQYLIFALNKPFYDQYWSQIYSLYYLLSNFIQNLCEDNFVPFKLFFSTVNQGDEENSSKLHQYQKFVEVALRSTNLYKNQSQTLVLSDKPQRIYLLNRVIEGYAEISNGSVVENKLKIFDKNPKIWIGILFRKIYDSNSNYHDLKNVVLDYLLGLLELYDPQIVEYFAHKLPVITLYDQIVFNIKLLYLKQQMLKRKGDQILPEDYIFSFQEIEDLTLDRYEKLLHFYKKYYTFSDSVILNVTLKIFHLIKRIAKIEKRFENFVKEKDILIQNASLLKMQHEDVQIWKFLNRIIVTIEISYQFNEYDLYETNNKNKQTNILQSLVYNEEDEHEDDKKNSKLITIFFRRIPSCFFLSINERKYFFQNVSIESLDQKHEDFFDSIEQFKTICDMQEKIYKRSRITYYLTTEQQFFYYRVFLFIVAVAINFCLLMYWDHVEEEFAENDTINHVINVIIFLSCVLSFILLVVWFVVRYPINIKTQWAKYYVLNKKKKSESIFVKYEIYVVESLLKDFNFQTFFFQFLFTLFGLIWSPFFYTLLLFLIINLSQLVFNVIQSFLINYDKLFLTLIIILAFINSFSYLLAGAFRNQFNDEDVGDDNLQICDTYFRCFINTINLGLRGGGGVSDYLFVNDNNSNPNYYQRFGFDLLFFIFINLILLGIFFGIIVDSFGELRDKMTNQKLNHRNYCLCCGLDRATLEKKGISYEKHIKYHQIWKYFYYVMYLKWKPVIYHDGIDNQVSDYISQNYNTSWLPIGRCQKTEEQI